ncbi:MAG: NUDIX hydrolase [bacterium]
MKRQSPLLTVDVAIFVEGRLVLIQRRNPPFEGMWALPGGFVDVGETVEAAAVREAREETSLTVELVALVGVFSDPDRDPRGHTVSVVFLAKPIGGTLRAADDARAVQIFQPDSLPPLAFDHDLIVQKTLPIAKNYGLI